MNDKEIEKIVKEILDSFLKFYKGYNTGLEGKERRRSIRMLNEVKHEYIQYLKENKPIDMHDKTMKDMDEGKITSIPWNS